MVLAFDIPIELGSGRASQRAAYQAPRDGVAHRRGLTPARERRRWSLSWKTANGWDAQRLLELWDLSAAGALGMDFTPPEGGAIVAGTYGLPLHRAGGTTVYIPVNGSGRITIRRAGGGSSEVVNVPDAPPPTGQVPIRRADGSTGLATFAAIGGTVATVRVRFTREPEVERLSAVQWRLACELEEVF